MTWEIFLGIAALFSFVIAVTGPMMKLNTSIIKLNNSVEVLQNAIDKMEEDNNKSHKRIWDHLETVDNKIEDHEKRLSNLEYTMIMTEKLHPEVPSIHTMVNLHSQLTGKKDEG